MPAFPLHEGAFTVDASKVFLPFDLVNDDLQKRGNGSLLVEVVPFLIQTKNDLIVIDPGLGFQSPNGEWQIHENIRNYGFDANDVTKVLLSHLHKDHAGGIAFSDRNSFRLMFPNAKYFLQQGETDYAFSKTTSTSYEQDKLHFLVQQANCIFLTGNGNISEEINFEITGGHTPFHQAFFINNGKEKFLYGGDVLPQSSQLIRKFIAKYDYDGKLAAEKRIELGKRAALENRTVLFFHDTKISMAKVKWNGKQFEIERMEIRD
jgi:glyoxylase-like metal-dependent hydrolase (beta-lactamase superfamily II)